MGQPCFKIFWGVKNLSQLLLGWPAIQALELVHIIGNVICGVSNYIEKLLLVS